MKKIITDSIILFLFLLPTTVYSLKPVIPGADIISTYLPLLRGKSVAVVANQTSVVHNTNLVDTLLSLNVRIIKIFSPEHGFLGNAGAGVCVENRTDTVTGLPIVSLYGRHRKPTASDMKDVDIVVFDMQDVGVRFYTYVSTLHLVMEACAEQHIPLLLLDRPNPNGFYVDGPVLDTTYRSFVGMDPVPIVYGMTLGEYAQMLNGEGWLNHGIKCDLQVVRCRYYTHRRFYELPINPSPNLPTMRSVYLYPSLCMFEGTIMNVGRGTDFPFEIYGHPGYPEHLFSFVPRSIPGTSLSPKYKGQTCYGVDLRNIPLKFLRDNRHLILDWLIDAYKEMGNKKDFFNPYFLKLAGTDQLQKQIETGKDKYAIRWSWKKDLEKFMEIRKKYLLYPDF